MALPFSTDPIGIVMATSWEAQPLLKAFGFTRIDYRLYRGESRGQPMVVCVTGVGKKNARAGADRLCSLGIKALVSAGFCGALVPELRVGDLVTEGLITVDVPARNRAERDALTEKTKPVAVDMETQAVVEAGTLYGIPIYALRVVSDELDDDLTPLFGADRAFTPWKIALRLLNPRVWPLASQLKRNSDAASRRLIAEVDAFLQKNAAHH